MRHEDEAPLDLGVLGAETGEPPEPRPERARRWWWVVAAAFVAGGAVGLVVAESRDDAAAYADVRLVSGAVRGLSDHADETVPGFVELTLLNIGEHEIEILGLEPAGMAVVADDEPGEPVPAPPGEWVTARQDGLIADCAGIEPGDGLRVRVRDAGGTERVVEADGLPDFGGVGGLWSYVCRPPDLVFPVAGPTIVTRAPDSLTMEVRVSNSGTEPLTVSVFEPDTAGLAAAGPELPFEVPVGESIPVPLTWTVTDCRLATGWPEAQISYAAGDDEHSRGHYMLQGEARAELVLLVDRVCGSAS